MFRLIDKKLEVIDNKGRKMLYLMKNSENKGQRNENEFISNSERENINQIKNIRIPTITGKNFD